MMVANVIFASCVVVSGSGQASPQSARVQVEGERVCSTCTTGWTSSSDDDLAESETREILADPRLQIELSKAEAAITSGDLIPGVELRAERS